MMTAPIRATWPGLALGLALAIAPARGQEAPEGGDPLDELNGRFAKSVADLETTYLADLAKLAPTLQGERADAAYEQLFRLAAARRKYDVAAPLAEKAMDDPAIDPETRLLGRLITILAAAEKGEFDRATAALERIVRVQPNELQAIPSVTRIAIADAFYQSVTDRRRYDIAVKFVDSVVESSKSNDVRNHFVPRKARLALLEKPAPPIKGTDVDGDPFDLAEQKGKVVLVIFWASWNLFGYEQIRAIKEAASEHADEGLVIIGVNVDGLGRSGPDVAKLARAIVRRAMVEHNLDFPNVLNGTGETDFATAYSVSQVPQAYLIGRDGKVVGVELTRANLREAIRAALQTQPAQ